MTNVINIRTNQAFHQLIEAFFKHQALPYKHNDIYDLALTLPGEEATPLVLMPLTEKEGLFLSKVILETDIDITLLTFFMDRNQCNIQSTVRYALNTDPQGQIHIMAQCQFNLQAMELPELLSLYDNYVAELSTMSNQLKMIKR
ncbi:hypothetical protein [Shewanella surugensis]|uniref:Molecular chaperone n=1 Tax=Shewanella surugensis TaxID=212020 RepID=A0ABT0L7N5_9GAMM|nr:hypothetical protein [Shewanella surugensis]MCL1123694.1 hypothetical protein [Shewanella surugensis]